MNDEVRQHSRRHFWLFSIRVRMIVLVLLIAILFVPLSMEILWLLNPVSYFVIFVFVFVFGAVIAIDSVPPILRFLAVRMRAVQPVSRWVDKMIGLPVD
jgi:uncharacterized protein (DUF2062 family)